MFDERSIAFRSYFFAQRMGGKENKMKITGTIEYTQRYFPSKACKTPHVRVLKKDV